MSNNTNTLFWIITGAVIILSVFLLINNSTSDTLSKITNKFDSMTKEVGIGLTEDTNEDETYPYDLPEIGSDFIKLNAGGTKSDVVEGYKVQVYDAYHTMDGFTRIRSRCFITNTNDTISNKTLLIQFFDCATDTIVSTVYFSLSDISPGQVTSVESLADSDRTITDYYIKAVVL